MLKYVLYVNYRYFGNLIQARLSALRLFALDLFPPFEKFFLRLQVKYFLIFAESLAEEQAQQITAPELFFEVQRANHGVQLFSESIALPMYFQAELKCEWSVFFVRSGLKSIFSKVGAKLNKFPHARMNASQNRCVLFMLILACCNFSKIMRQVNVWS